MNIGIISFILSLLFKKKTNWPIVCVCVSVDELKHWKWNRWIEREREEKKQKKNYEWMNECHIHTLTLLDLIFNSNQYFFPEQKLVVIGNNNNNNKVNCFRINSWMDYWWWYRMISFFLNPFFLNFFFVIKVMMIMIIIIVIISNWYGVSSSSSSSLIFSIQANYCLVIMMIISTEIWLEASAFHLEQQNSSHTYIHTYILGLCYVIQCFSSSDNECLFVSNDRKKIKFKYRIICCCCCR